MNRKICSFSVNTILTSIFILATYKHLFQPFHSNYSIPTTHNIYSPIFVLFSQTLPYITVLLSQKNPLEPVTLQNKMKDKVGIANFVQFYFCKFSGKFLSKSSLTFTQIQSTIKQEIQLGTKSKSAGEFQPSEM